MDDSMGQERENNVIEDANSNNDGTNEVIEADANKHQQNSIGCKSREASKSRSLSIQNRVLRSRTRSRSPQTSRPKRWVSSNAFINFVQDFRQKCTGLRSTRVLILAGERWRDMSVEEKQPYLEAAKNYRNKKQDHRKSEQKNKPIPNTDSKKPGTTQKQKTPEDNEGKKQSDKSENDTESDSDSTSGTTETLMSDASEKSL